MRPGKIVNNGGEIFNDYHNNQASGRNSHAEGCYNGSFGEASHTSGMYNSAYSTAEAAFGKFNLSSNNTYIFTVGVGTSTSNRKNALTISNDGNVNIGNLSVSNLTFSNIDGEIPATPNIITVTYTGLITLITKKELLPGCLYKITDYQTKVTGNGCYSNEQTLTLLVMAISEERLSPNDYIIDSKDTVRGAAKKFGISKSTVHKDVSERLLHINPALAAEVRTILDENKSERHIRGGLATKNKYLHMMTTAIPLIIISTSSFTASSKLIPFSKSSLSHIKPLYALSMVIFKTYIFTGLITFSSIPLFNKVSATFHSAVK